MRVPHSRRLRLRLLSAARRPSRRKALASRSASGLTLLEMLVVFVLASLVGTLLIQGAGFFLGQYDTVKRIGREASSEALQQRWFATTVHAMVPYLAPDRSFVGESNFFQGITVQPLRATPGIPAAARWSILAGEAGATVVYAEQPPRCQPPLRSPNEPSTQVPAIVGPPGRSPAVDASAPQPQPSASPVARPRSSTMEQSRRVAGAPRTRLFHGRAGDIACDDGTVSLEDTHWTMLESDDSLAFEYAGRDRVWRQRWPVDGVQEWIPRQVRLVTSAGQTLLTASFGLHFEPVSNPRDFR